MNESKISELSERLRVWGSNDLHPGREKLMHEAADELDASVSSEVHQEVLGHNRTLQAERDELREQRTALNQSLAETMNENQRLLEVLREIAATRHLTAPQDIEEKAANHDVMIERARKVLKDD